MFKVQGFKRFRNAIGILAVLLSIVFGVWLLLLMLGYSVDYPVFGMKPSVANYIRFLAEIVVASLLLAALAFL